VRDSPHNFSNLEGSGKKSITKSFFEKGFIVLSIYEEMRAFANDPLQIYFSDLACSLFLFLEKKPKKSTFFFSL
jgi:hypothetical protein